MATLPVSQQAAAPAAPAESHEEHFGTERAMALMVIAVAALYLRARDPHYATAYMDESIYVIYGRMFLTRHFEAPLDTPLQWSFGWYLWPAMAAVADKIGGLTALRELAAGLGMVTLAAVTGFAGRVFSKTVAVGTAAVFAMLAPAVLVSRIATRDSGSICFFVLGIWAYAAAWQSGKKRDWALAAAALFAAFLCKYLVAIYFPFLVLLGLRRGKNAFLIFSAPLFLLCAGYGWLHAHDLLHLLRYGSGYSSLRAPGAQAWRIYVAGRMDFWLLALLAAPTLLVRELRARSAALWAGAAVVLLFQWKSRADFDYWKHVNYALIFLAPLGVAGVVFLVQHLRKRDHGGQVVWGVTAIVALAGVIGWMGKADEIDQFVFWPNVDPVLAYFNGRLNSGDHVLVDDTVLRYYFESQLHQYQIADPMYFRYQERDGNAAYKAAVQDGVFDYVILDGGMGEEARRMAAAIKPLPSAYHLTLGGREPTLGQSLEVYEKEKPQAATTLPIIEELAPTNNELISGDTTVAGGVVRGAQPGWYVRVDIFTDRWYEQDGDVPLGADGSFKQRIHLGGEGVQQCNHLLRVRLFDASGKIQATALNYGITRANGDGSAPACR